MVKTAMLISSCLFPSLAHSGDMKHNVPLEVETSRSDRPQKNEFCAHSSSQLDRQKSHYHPYHKMSIGMRRISQRLVGAGRALLLADGMSSPAQSLFSIAEPATSTGLMPTSFGSTSFAARHCSSGPTPDDLHQSSIMYPEPEVCPVPHCELVLQPRCMHHVQGMTRHTHMTRAPRTSLAQHSFQTGIVHSLFARISAGPRRPDCTSVP